MRTGPLFGDREVMTGLPFIAAAPLYSSQQGNHPDPQQPSLRQYGPPPPCPHPTSRKRNLSRQGEGEEKKNNKP